MKHAIHIRLIDKGRVMKMGEISCEEEQRDVAWDSILFDYNELLSELPAGRWVEIEDRAFIPESHRVRFN